MSTIQKQKSTKSYAELLEEFANTKKRIAVIYIPLLCEAMRNENPDMSYMEIKEKVVGDAVEQGWNEPYIVRCLPSWIIAADPNRDYHRERVLKSWESRNKNKLKLLHQKAELINREISEPPEAKQEPGYSISEEKMDDLGFTGYGEKGKTMFSILQEIKGGAEECFRGLCDDKTMPYADEDLLVDYIKPTREYRLNIALELNKSDRADLHNVMHNLIEAAEDMIEQIEKADKK